MRILIVEDDAVLADGLVSSMRQGGHVADSISSGRDAEDVLAAQNYDLIILDLGLPGLDGFHVLSGLRKRGNGTPVLILTARDALEDRVRGLDLGADDYLTKPFDLPELEARVRALLRRGQSGTGNEMCLGSLRVDFAGKRVKIGDRPVDFSSRELNVLEVLIRNAGRVVSKEQLLQNLCGWDEEVSDNAIEVYVHRLRKKLEDSGICIRTIRGLGYLMGNADDA